MRAFRIDDNQVAIVGAARKAGASVEYWPPTRGGRPDLVIGFQGRNHFWEVKNPKTKYGQNGFNQNQTRWAEIWRGEPPTVVYSPEQAVEILNGLRKR